MSIELKPGWLERQARELIRPYTEEELAVLDDKVGPFPSTYVASEPKPESSITQ